MVMERWTQAVPFATEAIWLFAKWEAGLTKVSMPSMKSMRKKRMDQNTEPGRRARASGYATNAKPGPK